MARSDIFIAALDQGTTSSRTLVFDLEGGLRGQAQREHPQSFPRPGWVEHDAEAIWSTQLATLREALRRAGARARSLAAIGIANQRETLVAWDRTTGVPLAPAIVWQDRRTAVDCDRLREAGQADRVRALTGLVLDPYFSATKAAWLLRHVPAVRSAARRRRLALGTVDSWLAWRLTGGPRGGVLGTDPGNASRTLLYDLAAGSWSAELLDLFGIPEGTLGEIRDSIGTGLALDEAILGAPVPLSAIAGDQQASLFGHRAWKSGEAKNTFGTGSFLLRNEGATLHAPPPGILASVAWSRSGRRVFAREGAVLVSGAAIQWLRDGLGILPDTASSEALARTVPDSGGIVFVPAFAGLGTPWWDASARALLIGMTRGTTRAHIARATLEAMAHQIADLVEAMEGDGRKLRVLRVDGGGSRNALLLQLVADLIGRRVEAAAESETTALGIALMAGWGAGIWQGPGELPPPLAPRLTTEPAIRPAERRQKRAEWRRAIERCRGWA